MWREARLAFSDSVASVDCSIIPAHPWVYGLGQQTDNGNYLSPANAIGWLAAKLAGTGGSADVAIFMVTGQTHENFMSALNALAEVFPAPVFTQVRRLAESSATLALDKMQIPAHVAGALPPSVPLSVPTSRMALAAAKIRQAKEDAGAVASMEQVKQQLEVFGQQREAMLAQIVAGLGELQGKSARAWVFTAQGDISSTLVQLVKDIPQPSAVYTAAMMLVGNNLEGIRGMIHEFKSDAGA